MNTIKDLARKYYDSLDKKQQGVLFNNYLDRTKDNSLYDSVIETIENIFYNEVIVKWFETHPLYELCKTMVKEQIIEAYLEEFGVEQSLENLEKEHSKEEPKERERGITITMKEQPLSVNKDVEVDVEYPAGTVVRDMYNLAEDEFDKPCYTKLKDGKWGCGSQKYFTINKGSIGEGKRFKLISIPEQPKVENNNWDEVMKHYFNSENCNNDVYQLFRFLRQHYTLIKK